LRAKKNSQTIKVLSNRKRIIVNKGFVIITHGNVHGATKVRADIIEELFDIPNGVTMK
jgi:hypothetical protein